MSFASRVAMMSFLRHSTDNVQAEEQNDDLQVIKQQLQSNPHEFEQNPQVENDNQGVAQKALGFLRGGVETVFHPVQVAGAAVLHFPTAVIEKVRHSNHQEGEDEELQHLEQSDDVTHAPSFFSEQQPAESSLLLSPCKVFKLNAKRFLEADKESQLGPDLVQETSVSNIAREDTNIQNIIFSEDMASKGLVSHSLDDTVDLEDASTCNAGSIPVEQPSLKEAKYLEVVEDQRHPGGESYTQVAPGRSLEKSEESMSERAAFEAAWFNQAPVGSEPATPIGTGDVRQKPYRSCAGCRCS